MVVTGQQPGLFGGPLYTFYKAATACAVASRLRENDVPAVPLFWNHSGDHDLSEIDRVSVLDAKNQVRTISLNLPQSDPLEIGSLHIPRRVERALEDLQEHLRDTEFAPDLLSRLRSTRDFRPAGWFSKLLLDVFEQEGLLLFEPSIGRPHWAPVIENHLSNWQRDRDLLQESGEQLAENGYRPPLDVPDRPDLFVLEDGKRKPVRPDADSDLGYWLDRLSSEPENFSPGVALRVIVQDSFFPVLSKVGGPGEISYFSQVHPLYEEYNQVPPPVVPRLSMTILEQKIQKVIEKFQIDSSDLFSVPDRGEDLLQSIIPEDVEDLIDESRTAINNVLSDLREQTVSVNSNLDRPMTKTEEQIRNALSRYQDRVASLFRKEEGLGEDQLNKLENNLFPNEKPQERVLSPWHYCALYGPDFLEEIKKLAEQTLDDPFSHILLRIS